MYHAYMFRSNEQAANIAKTKFEEGLKRMRIILVNRYTYMRSTAIIQTGSGYNAFGSRVR
jgi:cell fate regulator YaaT (PSP1 superfamily)